MTGEENVAIVARHAESEMAGKILKLQCDPKILDGVFAIIRHKTEEILASRREMSAAHIMDASAQAASMSHTYLALYGCEDNVMTGEPNSLERDSKFAFMYAESAASRAIAAMVIHMVEHELKMKGETNGTSD